MNKIIIKDGKKKYQISSSNELYLLYNDYLITIDDEIRGGKIPPQFLYIVEAIRDYHQLVYDNIRKGKYHLEKFEKKAAKILLKAGIYGI
jgi:hypothetical protein